METIICCRGVWGWNETCKGITQEKNQLKLIKEFIKSIWIGGWDKEETTRGEKEVDEKEGDEGGWGFNVHDLRGMERKMGNERWNV